MSVNRTNWSALSSLTRQWTVEDEEEAERERRRRVKSSSSTCDQEVNAGAAATDHDTTNHVADSPPETSQSSSSIEQMQLDFMEMLRVRDERRRIRHVETLRRQKGVREDADEQQKLTPYIPKDVSANSVEKPNIEQENGEPSGKDSVSRQPSSPPPKFISSVSISIDKSPASPNRPLSPTNPRTPREHSPCQSPIPNGHSEVFQESSVNSSSTNNDSGQATKPMLIRKSSRTLSFRLMRKKEEENFPLQRSSSVRIASKKFETNTDQPVNEQKVSSFQRNSAQRHSSRSIQEKMERLAEAAQKSETPRSPDVSQRTLYLLDEVSRKRGLFENEQQTVKPTSPSQQQEFRGSSSGISDRMNRWLDKTNQTGCSSSPTDLKHVDITSKRSLFEKRSHDSVTKSKPGKIYK
ncbi:ladinin-1 [Dunckerocampus dactyliophorus]|uniref:ladinin-1 n=1 Tax=Dunckerocampus dactyliophorus TaxID=161453 RepID=UPI00240665E7|nr:ladinin-1 [Dunckerocampus dactyliophorus]